MFTYYYYITQFLYNTFTGKCLYSTNKQEIVFASHGHYANIYIWTINEFKLIIMTRAYWRYLSHWQCSMGQLVSSNWTRHYVYNNSTVKVQLRVSIHMFDQPRLQMCNEDQLHLCPGSKNIKLVLSQFILLMQASK